MNKRVLKPLTYLIVALSSSYAMAEVVKYDNAPKTDTIEGYAPYVNRLGSNIFSGIENNLRTGDIVYVPTDSSGNFYRPTKFNIVDKDGDKLPSSFEFEWYFVAAKPGKEWTPYYKEGGNIFDPNPNYVRSWDDVEARIIDKFVTYKVEEEDGSFSEYVVPTRQPISGLASSLGLVIPDPPNRLSEWRLGLCYTPITLTGEPSIGQKTCAPDLYWDVTNAPEESKPGTPANLSEIAGRPIPRDAQLLSETGQRRIARATQETEIPGGGVINESYEIRFYEDVDNDQKLTLGVDAIKITPWSVDKGYLVDILIINKDNSRRRLTADERATLEWVLYDKDGNKIEVDEKYKGSYYFRTQAVNSKAGILTKQNPPNYSQQGLQIQVQFEYNKK